MVYQPAVWFSTSDTVPSGESHFSSAVFSPEVAAPAALPVATVLASGLPIFMLVVSQPLNSSAAPAASSRAQDFLLFNIVCSPVKGRP